MLPKSLQISFSYDRTDRPQDDGTFGTVWRGECAGKVAAVKVLKLTPGMEVIRKVGRLQLAILINKPTESYAALL